MRRGLYRTFSPNRKNHVILCYDDIKNVYTVGFKLWDNSGYKEYTHFNHACWAFQSIHDTFKKAFKGNIITNLK